jgi:hypothetical protein
MIATPSTILSLLGQQPYEEIKIIDEQETEDIVQQMLYKQEACEADYDSFSFLFAGGTVDQICYRIWKFCRENFVYVEESTDKQYISKPQTMLLRKTSDCKGYALFANGILASLNRQGLASIDSVFRFASYKLFNSEPQHVFVVVQQPGGEIWIDPCFREFDLHRAYIYARDYYVVPAPPAKKISGLAVTSSGKIACLSECQPSGKAVGTTQQVGEATLKLAGSVTPTLVAIPVYGWIGLGALYAAGFLLTFFGDKYPKSATTGVRWLAQMFDYLVKGEANVTSDSHVQVADILPAQDWFSYVLGVPIYDKYRFFTLRGQNGDSGASLGWTQTQMVQNYLAYQEVVAAGTTYAEALQASQIALSMPYVAGTPPGSWAKMLAAPSVFAAPGTSPAPGTSSSLVPAGVASLLSNKWVLIGAGVLLLFLLFSDE